MGQVDIVGEIVSLFVGLITGIVVFIIIYLERKKSREWWREGVEDTKKRGIGMNKDTKYVEFTSDVEVSAKVLASYDDAIEETLELAKKMNCELVLKHNSVKLVIGAKDTLSELIDAWWNAAYPTNGNVAENTANVAENVSVRLNDVVDLTKIQGIEYSAKKLGGVWCLKGTGFPLSRIFMELASEESTLEGIAEYYNLDMCLLNDIFRAFGEAICVAHEGSTGKEGGIC